MCTIRDIGPCLFIQSYREDKARCHWPSKQEYTKLIQPSWMAFSKVSSGHNRLFHSRNFTVQGKHLMEPSTNTELWFVCLLAATGLFQTGYSVEMLVGISFERHY